MKKLTLTPFLALICLGMFVNIAFGQGKSTDTLTKTKLKSTYDKGYELGSGKSKSEMGMEIFHAWKVKYDDNPNYAKIDFDDSNWDTTSTNNNIKDFPDIEKNRIGWFRKRIMIDSSMIDKPYIMKIMITGAAEIYLNGIKIHEIGKVSLDKKKTKMIFTKDALPYSIYLKSAGEQVFAIRFLFTPHNEIAEKFEIFPLSVKIIKLEAFTENLLSDENRDKLIGGVGVGIFFMMAFIHFFFFYFFRSQKYNLSFSISMLLFGIFFGLGTASINYEDFNNYIILEITNNLIFLIAHFLLLNAVYEYLLYPKKILFWGTVCLLFFTTTLIFLQIIKEIYISLIVIGVICNYAFLIWKSVKNATSSGKVMRNAAFTFSGSIVISFVFLFLWAVILSTFKQNYSDTSSRNSFLLDGVITIIIILIFVGPQLSVSGAISFSLAKEFVKTNISLSQKLEEIEKLSEEKQHILSTQNEYLEKQVNQRTAELNLSLENLKITQNQLVQSEKLASLGELTAGIAHEIQNPLNFVNNFSEMSVELAKELKEEVEKPEMDKALILDLANDLSQNQEKITHHGKRASSIVKGMLEHSRTSTGVKELTDINKMADEFLRLAYHGLRAKDSTFNSDFKTNFDKNLPKINVVSQDIGRVLLNLISNSFYAVGKRENEEKKTGSDFKPSVIISTKSTDNQIVIQVKDNGTGMSEATKIKIFQPFFTTKPTGEGTGLGLSLSYDIVKAHGGKLECESVENEYTEFAIILPNK